MGILEQPAQAQQPVQDTSQPQQGQQVDSAKLQQHVANVVKAAHLFMYSKQTGSDYMKELGANMKSYPPKIAAAKTAVMVILMLAHHSQFQMMQQAVIPAGIMIAGEILDFIGETQHHKPSEQDAHDTIALFVQELQQQIGKITQGAQPQPTAGA